MKAARYPISKYIMIVKKESFEWEKRSAIATDEPIQ